MSSNIEKWPDEVNKKPHVNVYCGTVFRTEALDHLDQHRVASSPNGSVSPRGATDAIKILALYLTHLLSAAFGLYLCQTTTTKFYSLWSPAMCALDTSFATV